MPPHERVAYRAFIARAQIVRNEVQDMDGVVNAHSLHLSEPNSAGVGVEFQVRQNSA